MTNMFRLYDFSTTVTQYPYRSARTKPMFTIDRTTNEWREFENQLALKAGKERDNHVVYTIDCNGQQIHFMCSDSKVFVGTELILGDY